MAYMKILPIIIVGIISAVIGVAAGIAYSPTQSQLTALISDNDELRGTLLLIQDELSDSPTQSQLISLISDNDELKVTLLSLQNEVSDLSRTLESYQQIAAHQEKLAQSLRMELRDSIDDSIGDRLVVTEATYEDLPKTIVEAQSLGYSLMDTIDSDGKLVEAACFAHEDARHYAIQDSKITDGVAWHGAPLLLIYNSNSEKLMGMVLESTSPQPTPLWEHHPKGHPGMDFPHWSLHFWFVEPPENLSLGDHTH